MPEPTFKTLVGDANAAPANIRTLGDKQPANEANFEACFQDVANKIKALEVNGGGGGGGGTSSGVPRITIVPTFGHWLLGEWLLWGANASRLALRAQQTGALGVIPRVSSTAYTANTLLSSPTGGRIFTVDQAGTTAITAPAGMGGALYGDEFTDGTTVLTCVSTVNQGPDFASVPNLSAPAVALANLNATILITDGPVRECATATANRTTPLGVTGALQGDILTIRRIANAPGAFPWLLDGTSGGGDSVLIPASTRAIVRFVLNAAGVWVVHDCTGTLS
jgi:hypothetical protein